MLGGVNLAHNGQIKITLEYGRRWGLIMQDGRIICYIQCYGLVEKKRQAHNYSMALWVN